MRRPWLARRRRVVDVLCDPPEIPGYVRWDISIPDGLSHVLVVAEYQVVERRWRRDLVVIAEALYVPTAEVSR